MHCREPFEPSVVGRLAPELGDPHRRRVPTRRRGRSGATLTLMFSLSVALVALAGSVALAAAVTKRVRADAGGTSATLSYRANHNSALGPPYSKLRLTIARDGRRTFDATVGAPLCATSCWPEVWPGHSFLTVADADGTGSPDVILDLYSGGAHCCSIVQVYRFDPHTDTYTIVQRDFGAPGASLVALAGGYEFFSADDRFAYAFTSFAFSGLPVQIWRLGASGFLNVTRRFPARIATDAARQYRSYLANRKQGFGLGFIAAWAADEDLLGHASLVARTLAGANRDGGLRSADGLSQGSAFIASLQRFLIKYGYAS